MGYMFPRYFAETLLVPLALGIRPFAFREERMVNPIDFPCLYRFRKYRLRALGRYPPCIGHMAPQVPPRCFLGGMGSV
jgi:hypothetical protein